MNLPVAVRNRILLFATSILTLASVADAIESMIAVVRVSLNR